MRIAVKWLGEYVALPASVEELARQLTMAGLEVERIERPGEPLREIVVAQIRESSAHPNADKLSVTRVDIGSGTLLQVVCGAKNYRVGDKVPLARVGVELPDGTKIVQASLRGVESFGMLCSEKELALSEDASGLMILDPTAPLGASLAKVLEADDAVLGVDVTPNRPDALSHLGIAREVAVLNHTELRPPVIKLAESSRPTSEAIRVRIDEPSRCPRYAARVVENVSIGPSPLWLANRLKACGVRAINNVVDVTNYVMLEYGKPLHAFDLDRVGGAEIIVRLARAGEKLLTLDGKERTLDSEDLLICDRDQPVALGGVMGGGDSEVSTTSTRILLESAHFEPTGIRRTAKRHGLHTESSHRFERGMDINAVGVALDRAAELIAQLGKGTILRGRVDAYPRAFSPRRVQLRYPRVGRLLGAPVEERESHEILDALGFKKTDSRAPGAAIYEVPSFRVDVEREEDLIEEVARIRGYDSIPSAMPHGLAELPPEPLRLRVERRIRAAMTGAGFDEVINYSFVSPQQLSALDAPAGIALRNPLSVEQSVMRTTLQASLLQNLELNLRHQAQSVRLYELARIYLPDPEGGKGTRPVAREPLHLGGLLWGNREKRGWTSKETGADFYDAKGAVESVLASLGIRDARFEGAEHPFLHPRASATVQLGSEKVTAGFCGELHPKAAKRLALPSSIYLFELDVETLYAVANLVPEFQAIGRFPAVLRDLAVVVPVALQNDEVRRVILEVGRPLVEDAVVFDVYVGKPIPEGSKNIAYAIRYRSAERTLTDNEVNDAHRRIIDEVQRRLGGQLR
jgi:phenylalanyl-tRNA synthetase beta chain